MPRVPSRPQPTISFLPQTPVQWAVEVAAVLGLLIPIAYLVLNWSQIPAIVPTHFTGSSPDAWGSKSSLIILLVILGCIYLVLTLVSRFPHVFNYPVEITEQNAQRLYRIAVEMLRWIKLEETWLIGYLSIMTVQVALKRAEGLGFWVILSIPVLISTIIIFVVRFVRVAKA